MYSIKSRPARVARAVSVARIALTDFTGLLTVTATRRPHARWAQVVGRESQ